ncbi:MAG: hypothetical protein IKH45_00125 [Neisseriaceae bacterium]|nr:hypothetical protein [Neisseriaceae bacterium]
MQTIKKRTRRGRFRLPETSYKKRYCHYEPLQRNGVVISLLRRTVVQKIFQVA